MGERDAKLSSFFVGKVGFWHLGVRIHFSLIGGAPSPFWCESIQREFVEQLLHQAKLLSLVNKT